MMENALVFAAVISLDVLVGLFAHGRRNRSFPIGFWLSVLFSPLVGFPLVACSKTIPEGFVEADSRRHRSRML